MKRFRNGEGHQRVPLARLEDPCVPDCRAGPQRTCLHDPFEQAVHETAHEGLSRGRQLSMDLAGSGSMEGGVCWGEVRS